MAQRRPVQVRLTDEARDALSAVCAEHGITMTTLIEAIGLAVAQGHQVITDDMIAVARRIDYERDSRRRR